MPEGVPHSTPPSAAKDSFPNVGVSLRFLRRIRDDPRLRQPVCSLPFVSASGDFAPVGALACARDPAELTMEQLRSLAREYRVFSDLDGADEYGRYSGTIHVDRAQWVDALRLPARTTSQVCVVVVKVDTLAAGQCYAEMLRSRGGSEAADVGVPTMFLSHAWRYSFANLVDAVDAHYEDQLPAIRETAFVWNDIFVEDQNSSASKPPDYFFNAFKDAVGAIGTTVLVLEPWSAPIPLTRSWCIWEIYSTITTGATLSVAHSPAEHASFENALVENFESVSLSLSDVDAEQADAFSASDKQRIDATIIEELGGFAAINELVVERMRTWLARAGQAAIDAMRARCDETRSSWRCFVFDVSDPQSDLWTGKAMRSQKHLLCLTMFLCSSATSQYTKEPAMRTQSRCTGPPSRQSLVSSRSTTKQWQGRMNQLAL